MKKIIVYLGLALLVSPVVASQQPVNVLRCSNVCSADYLRSTDQGKLATIYYIDDNGSSKNAEGILLQQDVESGRVTINYVDNIWWFSHFIPLPVVASVAVQNISYILIKE